MKNLKSNFSSRRDTGLTAIIWILVVLILFSALRDFSFSNLTTILAFLLGIVFSGFLLWILYATNYEVSDKTLKVKSGPFQWTIPILNISAIEESNTAKAGPALSMDRLVITHERGQIIVSPNNRKEFIESLTARNPKVRISEDRA